MKPKIVSSSLGITNVDFKGAPISGVKLDTSTAYDQIPVLLQKYINDNDLSAWAEIVRKIDYIYSNLHHVLVGLDRETNFISHVQSQIKTGKKLVFKPNLVMPNAIEYISHGEGPGAIMCTEWPLIAAIMRWFHDNVDISYSQMAIAEGASGTFMLAKLYSRIAGRDITPEAVVEGKSGDFYGGWGFFFVRKYLAGHHPASHNDNPMNGYEESITGRFIPPGNAGEKLLFYDLNLVETNISKGRPIAVPDGANFKEIILHKVIVGGDPKDANDQKNYPGCILVNVPKLKMHAQDLLTNAIKNIGIGLYPTQIYSSSHTINPSLKVKLPHSPWVMKMDDKTNLPIKDKNGNYIMIKTAGMSGTQSDVIRAVQSQNIFMLHITDAINMINLSHNTTLAVRIPEGYIWASLDCVALDLFCARYCFKTIAMLEALKLKEKYNWPTEFAHRVPVAKLSGSNIITEEGIDSPLFRYDLYRYAESRGVGQQKYYVKGWDGLIGTSLVSLRGHLGRIEDGKFLELMTKTMYYNPSNILHGLQKTVLSYAQASDALTGSSLYKEYMDVFDENKDGIIDYDEKGRGWETAGLYMLTHTQDIQVNEEHGVFKSKFIESVYIAKNSDSTWNKVGHDWAKEPVLVGTAARAFSLSQSNSVHADLYFPGMFFGKGMWPSKQTVDYFLRTDVIYGSQTLKNITLGSLYGNAFQYADKVYNAGAYTGGPVKKPITFQYGEKIPHAPYEDTSAPNSIQNYFEAISKGAPLLSFSLYVPKGFGLTSLEGTRIPNVEETNDPEKIYTAHFWAVW